MSTKSKTINTAKTIGCVRTRERERASRGIAIDTSYRIARQHLPVMIKQCFEIENIKRLTVW